MVKKLPITLSKKEEVSQIQSEIHYCDYGCGQVASHKFKNGTYCCKQFSSQCPNIRAKLSSSTKNVPKTKAICNKCRREISLSSIEKHSKVCKGEVPLIRTSLNCRYCGKLCKNNNSVAQHERLCKNNPDRQESYIVEYNKSPNKIISNKYIKAKKLGLPKPIVSEATRKKLSENFKGRHHTEAYKKHMSKIAKERGLGGWHTSRSFPYKGVILDSSYEVTLAEDLDKNNIKWERPKPFLYILDGEQHRYYPDFFLPDFNVYVDTKNDFLIKNINPKLGISDVEKIKIVSEQNHVRILILDKSNLIWDKVRELL